ncbi:PEBP-like protein [Glarea lozoyensis ATCC 20868]|uniref:PEBP-like protein n=1 Tax=Glarea lozoyensis (strain ATCC 20868 / MF5171) TaxID=1116229 RepID=S3DEY4_GLAL2|nr:PEBP-like protein [Glarea lozoyensis ATCC 20868]EPE36285.1 PEBP-like protein [Glarea lozoyensis ATCC 20868]
MALRSIIYLTIITLFANYTIADQQKILTHGDGGFGVIKKALSKAKIIPQVLDDFTPKCFVVPSYSTGKRELPVALGNHFKTSTTKSRPSLRLYCPEMSQTEGLTIALTDPDAPSRDDPKWSEMCHWISVVPVPEPLSYWDFSIDEDAFGEELMEYKPPGPPAKTGYHRYVFVLLEGDNTNLTAPSDRQHWGTDKKRHGVRDWANREGLKVIGANYFVEKNKKQ